MANRTDAFLTAIKEERDRQRTMHGSEYDSTNSINDWIAIAGHYLNEPAKRKNSASFQRGVIPTVEEFQSCLIKAGAVILAALEHSDSIKKNGDIK